MAVSEHTNVQRLLEGSCFYTVIEMVNTGVDNKIPKFTKNHKPLPKIKAMCMNAVKTMHKPKPKIYKNVSEMQEELSVITCLFNA